MGEVYTQQPYHLPLDWNMQLHSLTNDTSLRNYRKTLSRVSKPSSAGNSPHSHPQRRRTMTTYNNNGFTQVLPVRNLFHNNAAATQRPPRPTSWHPSVKQQPQPYYVPNCHPSWLRGDVPVPSVTAQQQQSGMTSMYAGLSTPITCPMSGDLLSTNDYFAANPPSEPYNFLPPGPQVYTPVEPSDMLYSEPSEWSAYSVEGTPATTINGFVSTDPAMIDYGHESVASADDLTAPPTPDMAYNHQQPTLISTTQNNLDDGSDDLVAVGLYDEPSSLSFSSLLGGDNTCHPTGKGLKLEETFTPVEDDEEDGDAENDD
ncbi:conserved hypothetical protein [Talaromyces stipitatus ATCC 10500]|uniref:Uncharacterized protein n=1 Tax=Talaromyces stipitatus (strain ATCC 10500 / CBS 375.48 / QM 6759 / NRRL 1006) TaxID=441959 RepID=B8LST2_TALSN|nr:uncharacterized protein TSTA_064020 [Talaromyces stipitatus ATCC 10500]EED22928.1 conserved hypothetical protein [Talaromyces stipitatus ATCC 10500]